MNHLIAGILLACLATTAVAASPADEKVFDRNKGKLYAVYAAELKADPGLQGKVVRKVLELKIATDGRVTNCRIVSNDSTSAGIGEKLCARTLEFQFAPRPSATTFTKEFAVFPAG